MQPATHVRCCAVRLMRKPPDSQVASCEVRMFRSSPAALQACFAGRLL
jgi:hypothetical protein